MIDLKPTSWLGDIVWEMLRHSHSDFVSLACVSKQFNALTTLMAKQCPPRGSFGKVQWEKHGAKVGEEPPMMPISLKLYQDCAYSTQSGHSFHFKRSVVPILAISHSALTDQSFRS